MSDENIKDIENAKSFLYVVIAKHRNYDLNGMDFEELVEMRDSFCVISQESFPELSKIPKNLFQSTVDLAKEQLSNAIAEGEELMGKETITVTM